MEANKYLNTLIERAKQYIAKTLEFKEKFPEFFKQSDEILLGMTNERMAIIYQMSQIINDTQTIFTKVSSLLYFCKKLDIEIETENIYEIKELGKFIENHKPFSLDYNITEEGDLEIINEKDNKIKYDSFSKNIKNLAKNKILTDD